MKMLIVSLLALTVVSQAQAMPVPPTYICNSTGQHSPDDGYSVIVSRDLKRAEVSMNSIAGPQRLAVLNCSQDASRHSVGNDVESLFLVCSEPQLRDAGYSVNLSEGGFAGLVTGRLYEVTFAGSKPVANLICQQR